MSFDEILGVILGGGDEAQRHCTKKIRDLVEKGDHGGQGFEG